MKVSRISSICLALLALMLSACATFYQPLAYGGGYSNTQLGDDIFQVRFQANAYTSDNRTSQLLLRRCAELTLEQNKRYFQLQAQTQGSRTSSLGTGWVASFPSGQATIKMVEQKEEGEAYYDAVIIVQETDQIANGRLSQKAKISMANFQTTY